MKRCSKCQIEKPPEMFARCASRPDGLQHQCKACKRAYHLASYTPEKGRAAYERKREADLDGYRARTAEAMRAWRAANPNRAKEISLKSARKRLAQMSNELNRRRREKWAANPEAMRAKRRAYYAARPELIKAQIARHRAKYPDKVRERNARWSEKNAARKRAVNRAHYEANKERWRAYGAARKAAKLCATPKWAELESIRAFYMAAPDGFDVDHIIPLQGKTVCGLHCLANLQYLKRRDNQSKRHLWWPDMPEEQRSAA